MASFCAKMLRVAYHYFHIMPVYNSVRLGCGDQIRPLTELANFISSCAHVYMTMHVYSNMRWYQPSPGCRAAVCQGGVGVRERLRRGEGVGRTLFGAHTVSTLVPSYAVGRQKKGSDCAALVELLGL